jgi:hypothetical protein
MNTKVKQYLFSFLFLFTAKWTPCIKNKSSYWMDGIVVAKEVSLWVTLFPSRRRKQHESHQASRTEANMPKKIKAFEGKEPPDFIDQFTSV